MLGVPTLLPPHVNPSLRTRLDCSQRHPVPLEPWNTLHERVVDSARDKGWAVAHNEDEVPSVWCDSENVHIYVHANLPGKYHSTTVEITLI
jgi:hypothetical protein